MNVIRALLWSGLLLASGSAVAFERDAARADDAAELLCEGVAEAASAWRTEGRRGVRYLLFARCGDAMVAWAEPVRGRRQSVVLASRSKTVIGLAPDARVLHVLPGTRPESVRLIFSDFEAQSRIVELNARLTTRATQDLPFIPDGACAHHGLPAFAWRADGANRLSISNGANQGLVEITDAPERQLVLLCGRWGSLVVATAARTEDGWQVQARRLDRQLTETRARTWQLEPTIGTLSQLNVSSEASRTVVTWRQDGESVARALRQPTVVDGTLGGAWHDQTSPGQGLVLEVTGDAQSPTVTGLLLTYGRGGRQDWLLLTGAIENNAADVQIWGAGAGGVGRLGAAEVGEWGTGRLTWDHCNAPDPGIGVRQHTRCAGKSCSVVCTAHAISGSAEPAARASQISVRAPLRRRTRCSRRCPASGTTPTWAPTASCWMFNSSTTRRPSICS